MRVLFPSYIVASKVYLTNSEGKFLVVKPVYHPGWDIPSGHVDKHESPDAAAIRELFEETGIRVNSLQQRSVIFQPLCSTVQVIFSGTIDSSTGDSSTGDSSIDNSSTGNSAPELTPDKVEISEARWVARGDIALLPYAEEALDVLLDKRASYWVSMIKP